MAQQKINADQVAGSWTSYSASPAGWSSLTQNVTKYMKVGKLVTVYISLDGTSNSTVANIQLPSQPLDNVQMLIFRCRDGGTVQSTPGLVVSSSSTSQLDLYKNPNAAAWTSSGQKQLYAFYFQYIEA